MWQFGICGDPWHQRRQEPLASRFLRDIHPVVCVHTHGDQPLLRTGTKGSLVNLSLMWSKCKLLLGEPGNAPASQSPEKVSSCWRRLELLYTSSLLLHKVKSTSYKTSKANPLTDTTLHWHKREFGGHGRGTKTRLCLRTHTDTKQSFMTLWRREWDGEKPYF